MNRHRLPALCSFGAHGLFGPYARSSSAAFCQSVSSEVQSGARHAELVYRILYDLPLESLPDEAIAQPAVTMFPREPARLKNQATPAKIPSSGRAQRRMPATPFSCLLVPMGQRQDSWLR